MSAHERRTLDDPAWQVWFDLQYDACAEVDKLIEAKLVGQTSSMKAAVISSVIVHLAELQRSHIELELSPPTGFSRGDRVALVRTNDPMTLLKQGDQGTVTGFGPDAAVHVAWDSGSTLTMLPDEGDVIVNVTRLVTPRG